VQSWADFSVRYGGKYFAKGSSRPVFHIILSVFAIGYVLEYPHLSTCARVRTSVRARCSLAGGGEGRRAEKEAMRKYH
jgi:hypothetical protein